MRKIMLLISLLMLMVFSLAAETITTGSGANSVTVLSSTGSETVLQYRIGSYEQTPVEIEGQLWQHIYLPKEGIAQEKGYPQLPVFNRSIIIDDQARMQLELFDIQYQDFAVPVAPSKGIITRNIDPDTVPYSFGDVYQRDGFYPQSVAELSEPYIMRDFRGIVVQTTPFAYNPKTKILRVYTSYKVRVYADGQDTVNTLSGNRGSISRDFVSLYENRFINWDGFRYTPVDDSFGKLLVICHTNYMGTILPWVNWKIQKGIPTELVQWSTIGSTATELQTYIQNRYNADSDLTYVQLVGDAPQIPSLSSGGGGSDPSFSLVAGSDNYPDIFIGRFSAETTAEVTAQINKAIAYERDVSTSDTWLSRAMGIASAEGGGSLGDEGESDIVHMNNIRADLLGYGYTSVDQIYDPGASASTVTTNINAGRGFVNYVGHGSNTSWSTTGFSNTNASALTNGTKTPFIMDVACVNGNFVSITCFAEAWQRNANGGSVAIYASTINQSWNSPMRAQDEVTDLLIAEAKYTVGGLYYNGSCEMMDVYGTDGVNMFKTWHIFGDASLSSRTKTPIAMSVSHPSNIASGTTSVSVSTGVNNTLVAITYNNVIYGRAFTNSSGNATITLTSPPTGVLNYTITATAHNRVTYVGTIAQTVASGPWMEVTAANYDDTNNDIPEYNESGYFDVTFKNSGTSAATSVSTTLSCSTTGITVTDASHSISSLAAGASTTADNAYAIAIAYNVANGTVAEFTITMSMSGYGPWTYNFSKTINAPALTFGNMTISDPSGDNDGLLDPGETATVSIVLNNSGAAASMAGNGTLSCSTPGITIVNGSSNFSAITAGGYANLSFTVSAASSMSQGTLAAFVFNALAGQYSTNTTVNVEVGAPLEVIIGNGTSTQSYPIDRYYNYSGHEAIYLASEIGTPGTIKSIGFYKASGTDVNTINAVTIYMKNTSATTLATGNYSTTGYTQVYSGTWPNTATSGWMEVDLDTQFAYDGSNLSILTIKGYQDWIYTYPMWRYTTASSTRARQNRSDTAQPTSLTASTNLPNLKLELFPAAPYPVIQVNPSSVYGTAYEGAGTTATLSVSNTGTATLNWSTPSSFAAWGTVSPTSGSIVSGGNAVLTLTLNAAALNAGTYNASLVISSNAENQPSLSVPVTFTVEVVPEPSNIRFIAEWEPASGVLIAYSGGFGLPYSMIADLSNRGQVYVLVTSSTQSTASSLLSSNGVTMSNVSFIVRNGINTYWTRDYGPWSIFDDNGQMAIVDFRYNRVRPYDDAVNTVLDDEFGFGYYYMPLVATGGNVMTDGQGKMMSTTLIQSENDGVQTAQVTEYDYTLAEIEDLVQQYLGVDEYFMYSDPLYNSSIDHIDCHAKLLDVDKVMIARVPVGHTNYSALENVVDYWETKTSSYGTPYQIFRVDQTSSNEPYSNAFIFNNKIYVPQWNSTASAADLAAVAAYQAAMPGYTVQGYYNSSWLSDDAVHCRIHTIHDEQMIQVWHQPPTSITANSILNIDVEITHSNPLDLASTNVVYKHGSSGQWQYATLSQLSRDAWTASVPTPAYGETLYYYIQATDTTDRSTQKPLCGASDPFEALANTPNTGQTQTIALTNGWNLISSWVFPDEPDLLSVFGELINTNHLIKVQDENGNALLQGTGGLWQNGIGNFTSTEGYYVQVNADCVLVINGAAIDPVPVIPLDPGWNIVSYPYSVPRSAQSILQPLMDAGVLIKVQNDQGEAILQGTGGSWNYGFSTFEPGEAYYLNVSAAAALDYTAAAKTALPDKSNRPGNSRY